MLTLGFFYGLGSKPFLILMKKYFITLIVVSLFILSCKTSFAEEKSSLPSAKVMLANAGTDKITDNRARILRKFLEEWNSPLSDNAEDFVSYADKYNLDWRLVAAISGLESTYGHAIPPGSYNGWGWGIYGTNTHYFNSWEDGIETVSKGLREQYMDSWGATNVYEIGRIYAASPTWALRVDSNMAIIADFALRNPDSTLSLSL
ncbi:MAG: hypothetical protein A2W22_04520 [Candidatus Levybacteria bacterium RBG_16_35_11]|nr:MAG: hypothetical protein A2W22_04520 [Candidatus Levybacteria bacterium RBG_16_35_11]